MEAARKPGRPLEFTPELGRRICKRVARIGFEVAAAERAGIHRNTLRNWRERGEKGEEPFAQFAAELAAAKATYIETELANVEDARWKLERLDREQFGAPHRHEHTGKDGGAIVHKHTHTLTRDQSLEIVSKVLGVRRELVEGKFRGQVLEAAVVVEKADDAV